ncbi:hypothetical protein QCA50_006802 [Cerrena zonata]|uniref:Uncharacterized protein n=1 Tax=Cerrena zonata TaxID=2478898 RepID=A0AAW0GIU0_9APHY
MDHLSDLRFDIGELTPSSITAMSLGCFKHLRYLDISTDIKMLCMLFNTWHPPALVSVKIWIPVPTDLVFTTTEWYHIRDGIERLVTIAGQTLRVFLFDVLSMIHIHDSELRIPHLIGMFRPLTRVRLLEECAFNWYHPFNITDKDITDFANAWPQLRRIAIQQHDGHGEYLVSAHPTIQALVELATKYSKLRYICLDFTLVDLPPLDTLPRTKLSLESVQFDHCELRDVEHIKRLAATLHHLFPLIQVSNYIDLPKKSVRLLQKNEMEESGNGSVGT